MIIQGQLLYPLILHIQLFTSIDIIYFIIYYILFIYLNFNIYYKDKLNKFCSKSILNLTCLNKHYLIIIYNNNNNLHLLIHQYIQHHCINHNTIQHQLFNHLLHHLHHPILIHLFNPSNPQLKLQFIHFH